MLKYELSLSGLENVIDGIMERDGMESLELSDFRDGCLLDYRLYESVNGFSIMALEKYVNPWSSCYAVTIARTEGDCRKLRDRWNRFIDKYDKEYEEAC